MGMVGKWASRLGSAMLLAALGAAATGAAVLDLRQGELVPDLRFEALLTEEDYPRLGLGGEDGAFGLQQVPGEVLVLEFFNKSCVPCQRQVREVEDFYRQVWARGLGERIRVLAVAAGNQAKYLGPFRKARGLTYPITADPHFDQWRRIGEPGRTPFTVYLRRVSSGWALAQHHFGGQDRDEIWDTALAVLEQGPSGVAPDAHRPAAPRLAPPVDQEVLLKEARRLLSRVTGRATEVAALEIPGGPTVYRAASRRDEKTYFARLGSRPPVCEICHGVHFLFAFDQDGRVAGFQPIQVTKWGNEAWSPQEAQAFESRLVGRAMGDLTFEEEVDAVSTATISSSLIFDEIRRSADLPGRLRSLP